jgi:outer membrane protein TolC
MKRIQLILLLSVIVRSAFAQSDSLNHYLQTGAENNPGVQAAFSLYQASLQKAPQAGAYQDMQFDMGFFLQPMELVEGRQFADFKLMQMFPWFGARKAARTEAQQMAKMAYEQFRETRNQLWLDIYTQWFTLCRLQQQLENSRENKKWLLQLEELSLRKFTTGNSTSSGTDRNAGTRAGESVKSSSSGSMSGMSMGGASVVGTQTPVSGAQSMESMGMGAMSGVSSSGMSSVLLVRIEIIEIDNDIESRLSEIQAEKAKFNALLNRPPASEVHLPDSIAQIPFLLNENAALEQIAQENPMLNMIREEESAYRAKAEMDRKMSYPMFGVGLQYMLIGKKPATTDHSGTENMSSMNGKDMFMPMFSISVPLFRNKYRAQQRENAYLQKASREKYDNTLNLLEAELHRTKYELNNAARKIELYRKQSELSQSACNLLVQEFASGKSDLTGLIQAQRQLLDYKLKTAEAVATYNTMVANIQKLISSNQE